MRQRRALKASIMKFVPNTNGVTVAKKGGTRRGPINRAESYGTTRTENRAAYTPQITDLVTGQ